MAEAMELSHIPNRRSQSTIDRALDPDHVSEIESIAQYALPPVDGGRQAWMFLAGATFLEILIWGLPFSVGILHVYWTNTLFVGYGASTLTLTATLQTGLLYMSCAFFGPLFTTWPKWRKTFQYAGLLAAALSMIFSAFASKPWHLLVTIGLIYPLSGACYLPCATLLFEWWQAKRGFASGMMYAGTGLGGCIFPFLTSGLLGRFGYKATMISFGVGYAVLGSVALIPIRRRIPLSRYDFAAPGRRRQKFDWSFLKTLPMFMGVMTILLTSLGNFIPSLWLPSYADDLNLHNPSGTALIAILNGASVPGNALLGFLSDRFPLRVAITLSCVGSALACAFLWGFGMNAGMLITFAVVFGLLGPSFSAVWSKMIGVISMDDPVALTLIFSIFAFTRGIGNITSGPISQVLLKYNTMQGAAGAYGLNNYGILLVYTATTIIAGGATGLLFKGR
ncbi:monocarboxylic acid transporter [Cryptococcus deuterogattii 99/473]|uniref:Monocarboxylic acid transporter n=1 Tax=Cryptococcus deuterogattii (strain R265) TaxID=294750 RepID=A0A095C6N5_CRYD2|nr:monocarboxylic acid transporter [Cryptococcus deuterogattii R265]KIR28458.1 monocarboxylic acid transporter [Cryptococcus deuterogattii LA55]KIR34923.1 monocarboxylic acid transporter [Cryptococcus deuterogattii MMRL2647]KIR70062.1 monocarboxylic acid transporter [Cryptococcus deuterogattii CA1014]KIR93941.1 monocarboxylic acid transporter [Cryptococcus deuterogattii CBS 10090]KIS00209.1 monocarboxylic acid transporter [Cryptococcus deuterogattii 2001/935-1]KIY56815.1 monocarboxylic acid t